MIKMILKILLNPINKKSDNIMIAKIIVMAIANLNSLVFGSRSKLIASFR